jgi:hypothetical protein
MKGTFVLKDIKLKSGAANLYFAPDFLAISDNLVIRFII